MNFAADEETFQASSRNPYTGTNQIRFEGYNGLLPYLSLFRHPLRAVLNIYCTSGRSEGIREAEDVEEEEEEEEDGEAASR